MGKKNKGFKIVYIIILLFVVLAIILFTYKKTSQNDTTPENNKVNKTANLNFKVNDIKCSEGQEITVEIKTLEESDFIAANFEYVYDSDNLEYTGYEIGNSLQDAAMFIVNNEDNKVLIGYVSNPGSEEKIKAGEIIKIKFKTKENISNNKIENKFDCTTLKKSDGTDVKFSVQQGIIEIQ